MEKRKIEFELDVNKFASWSTVIVAIIGVGLWFLSAQSTHNKVDDMPPPPSLHLTEKLVKAHHPRIKSLERNNEEYQDLWAQQIKDRKQYIEKAVEVCKKAGKCN